VFLFTFSPSFFFTDLTILVRMCARMCEFLRARYTKDSLRRIFDIQLQPIKIMSILIMPIMTCDVHEIYLRPSLWKCERVENQS